MGNKVSSDVTPQTPAVEQYKHISLFVLIGGSVLFEVKRKRVTDSVGSTSEGAANNVYDCNNSDVLPSDENQSKMQVSIVQVPLKGISASNEKIAAALDLGPIRVHKTRRNSLHSHAVGFTVDSKKVPANKGQGCYHNSRSSAVINENKQQISLQLDISEITGIVSVAFAIDTENLLHHWPSGSDSSLSQFDDVSSLAIKVSELLMSECVVSERVERWATKLAKAIESRVKLPTKIIIQETAKGNGLGSVPKTTILPHPAEAELEARRLAKQRKRMVKKVKKSVTTEKRSAGTSTTVN